ncbi:MoaD/ThiS family protein [Desulfurococcus mucosus]|nr:MoaD/ThiS family protein [Desulfurococcus mucosus]
MRVTLVVLGRASDYAGVNMAELELPENSTLKDAIRALSERTNPVLYERYINGHYIFVTLVNGKPVLSPETPLKDGDRITLVTPEMGG